MCFIVLLPKKSPNKDMKNCPARKPFNSALLYLYFYLYLMSTELIKELRRSIIKSRHWEWSERRKFLRDCDSSLFIHMLEARSLLSFFRPSLKQFFLADKTRNCITIHSVTKISAVYLVPTPAPRQHPIPASPYGDSWAVVLNLTHKNFYSSTTPLLKIDHRKK